MYQTKAYAAAGATSPVAATKIARRDPLEHDVQIEILFCGICHSDLHSARNEWSEFMPTVYPIVPGHEIVGRVRKVGSAVSKYKSGDLAAVGCLVDSDRTCPHCKAGRENFCPNLKLTFNPRTHISGALPTVAIPIASWLMSASFFVFPPIWILPGPRRCCARESQRIHPCAGTVSARVSGLEWLVSADLGIWQLSLPMRLAPTWLYSPRQPARRKTRCGLAPTKLS